tara:strand:+ start:11750 stop:13519 length:1770 start_codon:yes stop_codon:yes gene_type:complete
MPIYNAPLDDLRAVLFDVLKIEDYRYIPAFGELDRDTINTFLHAAAKICEEVAQPLNQVGDIHGCQIKDGNVTTPPGFAEAYRTFAEGGWIGLALAQEHGGQNLPAVLAESFYEILCSANMAFSGYIELSEATMATLAEHAEPALKSFYLPRLASGQWTGAMHLTEAHAGSDLGMVRTRAERAGDGTYRIHGQKIFITNGEHDLAENIVNLVLARLPDAPLGTRGLSLFLVPKYIPRQDGSLGARNAVECISLEHKMGLKAAPTGTYAYEGARGWLVGEECGGITAMFSMVNDARLGVAIQGLAMAELATQNAGRYACERIQGRTVGKTQASPPEPIVNHPDVRRMLLTMNSFGRPARALGLWVALQIDISRYHPDAGERARADRRAALLTPVIKSVFTDWGCKVADLGIQVHGGHGYVRDTGVEQFLRDARVTRIYEGTNGIQAIDLVRRKIRLHDTVREYFDGIQATVTAARASNVAEISTWALDLERMLARLDALTHNFATREYDNEAASGAVDYQALFGLVSLGWMWLKILIAEDCEPRVELRTNHNFARFFFRRVLPEGLLHAEQAALGGEDLMAPSAATFNGN